MQIAKKLQMSRTLTNELLNRLSLQNVITTVNTAEYETAHYVPALPVSKMTVLTVLERYDDIAKPLPESGENIKLPAKVVSTITELKKAMASNPANTSVIELLK